MSDFGLDSKTVIITGGAGLLGTEYAHALAQAGANVVIADIQAEQASNIAQAINHKGATAIGLGVDITDKSSIDNLIEQTLQKYGTIDGLVNNASINPQTASMPDQQISGALEELDLDEWNAGLAVNLTGMLLCMQAVAPAMLTQGHGSIVNISSIYGLVAPDQRLYERDNPDDLPFIKPITYTATKSAVIGLTKYAAAYWGSRNIRVNTLTLGGVFNNHEEEFVRRYTERTPMKRMAKKHEYNGALIFLLSDASSYMTGSNLVVDGGWTAW